LRSTPRRGAGRVGGIDRVSGAGRVGGTGRVSGTGRVGGTGRVSGTGRASGTGHVSGTGGARLPGRRAPCLGWGTRRGPKWPPRRRLSGVCATVSALI